MPSQTKAAPSSPNRGRLTPVDGQEPGGKTGETAQSAATQPPGEAGRTPMAGREGGQREGLDVEEEATSSPHTPPKSG